MSDEGHSLNIIVDTNTEEMSDSQMFISCYIPSINPFPARVFVNSISSSDTCFFVTLAIMQGIA